MKKIAMLAVKGAVGLLPKAVKEKLKSNYKLTEFYSRSLQRSGLFYGFPSKKKRMAQYNRYLASQKKRIANELPTHIPRAMIQCVVVGNNKLDVTREALRKAGVVDDQVFIISPNIKSGKNCFTNFQEAITNLDCDYPVLFLNSGDTVHGDIVSLLSLKTDTADILYCDTDRFGKKGKLESPHFLPDWNYDFQLSAAYIFTGVVFKASVLKQVKVANIRTISGLVTVTALKQKILDIRHLPYTLVHRGEGVSIEERLGDIANVVQSNTKAEVRFSKSVKVNALAWPAEGTPLVSLIVPTKNGKDLVKACIESIVNKSTYQNYEILLIDNGSTETESLEYFEFLKTQPKIRVLNYPGPFNYSAINNFGVKHAKGNVIGLVNNDIEVISPLWLDYMVGHALREDIGCVGAKLLYSDGRIQHAGVVLGYGGGAGHAHKYFPRYHPGYLNRLAATQNYSAVTAACLLVRKSLFEEVGGLNEKDLAVAFNDVDFCLRIRELGKRNVYCAEAELFHHESVSRGLDIAPEKAARFNRELAYLQNRWADVIAHDPAYSPNLTLRSENFAIKEEREYISSSDS